MAIPDVVPGEEVALDPGVVDGLGTRGAGPVEVDSIRGPYFVSMNIERNPPRTPRVSCKIYKCADIFRRSEAFLVIGEWGRGRYRHGT